MSEHTPGPWLRDRRSGLNCDVRAANGRKVALCWGLSQTAIRNSAAYRAECDANAVLIAAAPQLLEACEAVSRLVEILDRKCRLATQRRGGTFGIAVDESPIGREWQALDAEERAIRGSVDAAIRAAAKESKL